MDGLRVLLLVAGVIILLINFFINSGNIIKIVKYCFQTNSIANYWDLIFKSCFSGRAIISSLIGLILAIIIFIIITPIILIRSAIGTKKVNNLLDEGLFFQYQEAYQVQENLTFKTNINHELNINMPAVNVSGKLRVDAIIAISEITKEYEAKGIKCEYKVMHKLPLENKTEALIPLFLTVDSQEIPTYFIYTPTHVQQYKKIRNKLYTAGYKKTIYFSTIQF
ncbi:MULTISPECIES: hypothetical protein [unclassified Cellulophaga]|uniref:hypothetical protein n=1 Tax=unclassified Cellulophaga TaxID=2634405 RepID=UPI0026E3E0AF|nr:MULTISPECIES: hypothetical protein [unclassified Cellulophaga]MDO6491158.1 hypothetical protein [Cellulophaga sp. 2_MG-2023]MDO6495309.1 hypothetical protein [Cellulophaga sp. 3_MG-2023]